MSRSQAVMCVACCYKHLKSERIAHEYSYQCIHGVRKQHKGFTFRKEEISGG